MNRVLPILTVLLAILVIWYGAAVWLNAAWTYDQAGRAGTEVSLSEVVRDTMVQERPVLPPPHQVFKGLWDGVAGQAITSKRSLVYHGWVTLSATLLGFAIGTGLGILLAVGIVHNRAMDLSVMPWAIASQTIPILAIAPMIIVVLASLNITGIVPKAIISAYLSFFPVVVGMVKGLRSPELIQLDLMRTYSASTAQVAAANAALEEIDYAAVSYFRDGTNVRVTRYVIFDYGISKENLNVNLRVFINIEDAPDLVVPKIFVALPPSGFVRLVLQGYRSSDKAERNATRALDANLHARVSAPTLELAEVLGFGDLALADDQQPSAGIQRRWLASWLPISVATAHLSFPNAAKSARNGMAP